MEYLMLYNLFGYTTHGTKRVLLRAVNETPAVQPVSWQLISVRESVAAEGTLKEEPVTYGIRTWSCDFSQVTYPELYTLSVWLSDGTEMRSDAIDISDTPYLNQLSVRLSTEAAKARFARGTKDGGYYDCNSRMGEAYSHGIYLNGLSWLDTLQGHFLTPWEKRELRWAQQVAFDYLIAIHDDQTGEFRNCSPDRPASQRNFGLFNTAEALYGVTAYLSLHGEEDRERLTDQNRERIRKSFDFLMAGEEKRTDIVRYPGKQWLPVICCHMFRIFRDRNYLQRAEEYLQSELKNIDLRSVAGANWKGLGIFEGMWLLRELDPEGTAALQDWEPCMKLAQTRLYELLERNAYQFPPVAVEGYAEKAWDDMETLPDGDIENNSYKKIWFVNNDILLWGLQFAFLSLLTENPDFLRGSAAALNFVCGMNFGVPGKMVIPETGEKLATASFFAGMKPAAKVWKKWYYHMNGKFDWSSIVNGYSIENGQPVYSDSTFVNSETFIKQDGMFLYLASLYEQITSGNIPKFS